MLKAENIVKSYSGIMGENRVLDGLCLDVKAGEFCIVTGKSGCGKSTLLNVLSCLDSFDEGSLFINGISAPHTTHRQLCRMRRRDIAFIFQGYNLISSLDAVSNVALGLKYKGVPRQKRLALAQQALCDVGLADRLYHLPHQLSGGQQQRAAVARALVLKPKILFCDEPTGNLDGESAALVLDKINQLRQKGTAVVMITHDMSLLPLADSVYLLEKGVLLPQ